MLPFERFAGFRLIQPLGKPGGFGSVYLAERDGERFAVKLFHAELVDGVELERFEREVRGLRKLSHRNVVRYADSGCEQLEGRPHHWIAMPYLPGRSLREELAAHGGRLDPRQVRSILRQIAAGLVELHKLGIVHRDLKPENVFLCDDGTVKLLDFGVARFLDYSSLTQHGGLVGTMRYAAPEQFRDDVSTATDLFALGVVGYELLAGRRPFEGHDIAVMRAILDDDPEPPSAYANGIPPELDALIGRLLEKEPFDRPRSAAQVVAQLAVVALVPRPESEEVPYDRAVMPLLFVRLGRGDADHATNAALSGALPHAFVAPITDPSAVRGARSLARQTSARLIVDPQLLRMGYAGWSNTIALTRLTYRPAGLGPHRTEQLRDQAAVRELARSVVSAQSDANASLLLAAGFPFASSGDPWLSVCVRLLEESLAARGREPHPVFAPVITTLEAIGSTADQIAIANRIGRPDVDGYVVALDWLSAASGPGEIVMALRFMLLLQERGRPVVAARPGALRSLLWAFGVAGVEIGLGRYERFRLSDFKQRSGAGPQPPRFELPSLLCSLPAALAQRVIEQGLVPEAACSCVSCRRAGTPVSRVAAAREHNAAVVCRQRDALAGISTAERLARFADDLSTALRLARRLRMVPGLAEHLRHLQNLQRALDLAIDEDLHLSRRIRRREVS
jgi:serine/threonine-protein kinase